MGIVLLHSSTFDVFNSCFIAYKYLKMIIVTLLPTNNILSLSLRLATNNRFNLVCSNEYVKAFVPTDPTPSYCWYCCGSCWSYFHRFFLAPWNSHDLASVLCWRSCFYLLLFYVVASGFGSSNLYLLIF